eukprot:205774-Rhodomonas_salina.2
MAARPTAARGQHARQVPVSVRRGCYTAYHGTVLGSVVPLTDAKRAFLEAVPTSMEAMLTFAAAALLFMAA